MRLKPSSTGASCSNSLCVNMPSWSVLQQTGAATSDCYALPENSPQLRFSWGDSKWLWGTWVTSSKGKSVLLGWGQPAAWSGPQRLGAGRHGDVVRGAQRPETRIQLRMTGLTVGTPGPGLPMEGQGPWRVAKRMGHC